MTAQTLPIPQERVRPGPIQRPVRLALSAIAMWFVWVVPTVRLGRVLPADVAGSPSFVAVTWMVFAALVAGITVAHVRRVGAGSAIEGLLAGFLMTVLFVILDIGHVVLMHPALLSSYSPLSVAPYLVVPAITTPLVALLRRQ
jgi:hypothetical protein